MSWVKRQRWTLASAAAAATALGALYSFAGQMGFKVDRPAWHSEVEAAGEEARSELIRLAGMSLSELYVQKDRELFVKEQQRDALRARRLAVPYPLQRDIDTSKAQLNEWCKYLKQQKSQFTCEEKR